MDTQLTNDVTLAVSLDDDDIAKLRTGIRLAQSGWTSADMFVLVHEHHPYTDRDERIEASRTLQVSARIVLTEDSIELMSHGYIRVPLPGSRLVMLLGLSPSDSLSDAPVWSRENN